MNTLKKLRRQMDIIVSEVSMVSNMRIIGTINLFLPPANVVCEGYVFTRVCHSVHGGWYPSMHCRWYPSMPCSRSLGGGIPAYLADLQAHTQEEVEGDLAGGVSRPTLGMSPGPHLGGVLQAHTRGGFSRPTPGGVSRPTSGVGSPGPHLGGCVYPSMH